MPRSVRRLYRMASVRTSGVIIASFLPFSDTFTRANGALGNPWLGGNSWTIASNVAVNTLTLGSELIVNGAFATDTDWTKGTGWAIAVGVGAHTALGAGNITQAVLTSGLWYKAAYTTTGVGGGAMTSLFGTTVGPVRNTNATFTETGLANGTTAGLAGDATLAISIDNVSYKALTLSALINLILCPTTDVTASVPVTLTTGFQGGVALNWDSQSSPANGVIGYTDGTNCLLVKNVAGTWSTVITGAITYGAGKVVKVSKVGTSYSLFYNSIAVGTAQTISDAGIISNKNHGVFSTDALASLGTFSLS